MIGHTKLLEELTRLVKRSRADATSVCAQADARRVSRFAYENIHQDVAQENCSVSVKVVLGKRVGVAVTDTLERTGLVRCLHAAVEIARHAPPVKELAPLPGGYRHVTTQDHVAETAQAAPEAFLKTLKHLFQLCRGVGAQLAGSFAVGEDELAVVNSNGVACYAASTITGAKLVTMYRTLSGFAAGVHRRLDGVDLEALLERSLKQSLHRRDPITLPIGTYEVILEPEAVAELLMWFGYIACGAKSFQERTSPFAGRMGEQIMARRITLIDDGHDPSGLRMPFDYEGVPKQRVALIDRGRAASLVYDTTYGAVYGHPSTGHALPPDETEGPLPAHLFLEPGSQRRDDLIRACTRGLLIPRFHYVSGLLNPREALMTGLTREGAFLIEDGKLTRPITTMRFTQSLLEALRHVLGISKERQLIADPTQEGGCSVMPTLRLAKFRFTGRSEG
ncbi:MAG: TldD/PmbA family protein [Candidatus Omnitrophica bacterium]|nr:TldD/PmbA family protein [Candidatus Omnitrophota bacterium]